MKKPILILILTTALSAGGQNFPTDSAYWKVQIWSAECVDPYGTSGVCYEQQYFLRGDTSLGEVIHQKVYSSMRIRDPYQGTWTYDWLGYYGAVYSDNEADKVYWRTASASNDTLLYDFNLNVGDPLPASFVYDPQSSGTIYIDNIDTIEENGVNIVRYHMDNAGWGEEYLLHGLGSTLGLLEPIFPFFEIGSDMLCFKNYTDSIIFEPLEGNCDIFTGINDLPYAESIIGAYPNPANDNLYIDNATGSHVQLFSAAGLLISESEITSGHSELSLTGRLEGIYYLRFEKDRGIEVIKIVVNK